MDANPWTYAVTAQEIERRRDTASKKLADFLKELGHEP